VIIPNEKEETGFDHWKMIQDYKNKKRKTTKKNKNKKNKQKHR